MAVVVTCSECDTLCDKEVRSREIEKVLEMLGDVVSGGVTVNVAEWLFDWEAVKREADGAVGETVGVGGDSVLDAVRLNVTLVLTTDETVTDRVRAVVDALCVCDALLVATTEADGVATCDTVDVARDTVKLADADSECDNSWLRLSLNPGSISVPESDTVISD
jgi:hypothetical protein